MDASIPYRPAGAVGRDRAHTLFAQTMGYVAVTAGLFALGAYLGRDLVGMVGIVAYVAAFGCLIGMQFAVRRSMQLTVGLLCAFGLLIGLAVAPTIAYYASADPQALWQAAGATALFIGGFGAAGYATRRDLTVVARIGFWALVALLGFGIVLIFVNIPHGALIYSILGLVIFAGFTLVDFQRVRRSTSVLIGQPIAAALLSAGPAPTRIYLRSAPDQVTGVQALLAPTAMPADPGSVTVGRPSDLLIARGEARSSLSALALGSWRPAGHVRGGGGAIGPHGGLGR